MNTVLSLIVMLSQNTLKADITNTIACYIIEHMDEMHDKSIKQLSEDCYTSTTSINKFCSLLGFNSYSEFKTQLLSNFKTRKMQLKDKHEQLNVDDLFCKINEISEEKIDKTIFFEMINYLVELIKEKKKIYFYGAVFPLALTQAFIEDMSVMNVVVFNKQLSRGINDFDCHKGVHIILTLSGRYLETKRSEYNKLCQINKPTVLISKEKEYIGNVTMNIPMPNTKSTDYDDIILLLLLDIIKLKYYESLKI